MALPDYTNESRVQLSQPQMGEVRHFEWNRLENPTSVGFPDLWNYLALRKRLNPSFPFSLKKVPILDG